MKYILVLALLSLGSVSLVSCAKTTETPSQSGATTQSRAQTSNVDYTKSVKVKIENSHQLAGKTLNFDVELMKLTKWSASGSVDMVEEGDTIEVHYTGKDEASGEMFDTSRGKEPLSFTVGTGMMIQGFDTGVVGMKVGDTKTLLIAPNEAYGEKEIIETLPMEQFRNLIESGVTIAAGEKIPVQWANLEILEIID